MQMYLRYAQEFKRERLALDVWRRYHNIGAEVLALDSGAFTVRLPLGKRPQAIYKYLQHQDPDGTDRWLLVGVLEDGSEVPMQFPPSPTDHAYLSDGRTDERST